MATFTGKAVTICISVPADMAQHARERAAREDRSISSLFRRSYEADIHAHAQAKARDADK